MSPNSLEHPAPTERRSEAPFTDHCDGTPIPGTPAPCACPFCGSHDVAIAGDDGYNVECSRCGCMGPCGDTQIEAAVAWNKRSKKADPNETSVDFVVRPGDDDPELMLHALAAVTQSIELQDISCHMDRGTMSRVAGLTVAAQLLSGRLAERIA